MHLPTKNGIWAWTGILLAVAGSFIYNIGSKMDDISSQKRRAASATVLTAFFKNEKNTAPLASKMHAISYFTDSCMNDDGYEKNKLDTSRNNLLKLYISALASQRDSLSGYNRKNTLLVSYMEHKKGQAYQADENIKRALEGGEWKGFSDTATVFADLQKLTNYKYMLVLKEYNRAAPIAFEKGFNSGISLADAAIINIESRTIEHRFKVMGTNSDSVSHFSYGRRAQSNMPAYEWLEILESDLNNNTLKKATNYVFAETPVVIGPRRY
jgi:hypothetical protein